MFEFKVDGSHHTSVTDELRSTPGIFAPDSIAAMLQQLLGNRHIVLVDPDNQPLNDRQVVKMLTGMLPDHALKGGSASDPAFKPLLDAWADKINGYANNRPEVPLSLKTLILGLLPNPLNGVFNTLKDEPVLKGHLDQDVIDVYLAAMEKNEKKRQEIRDQLASLAAESKIFSIIQSIINGSMANKQGLFIGGFFNNLNDKSLYGYTTEEQWKGSAEYKLLSNLDKFPATADGFMSIADFLSGATKSGASPQKESGAMDNLKALYQWDKDNNPLASFAGAVGDRARMVNDKVSQQTVILKDVTSRYDTAIEGMNRFIDKFYNLLTDILRAI